MRAAVRPRLGFLGVGWIGRNRLEAVVRSESAEIAALADPAPDLLAAAAGLAPGAAEFDSLERLLEADLDGVVIATPSALHAAQALAALERGLAVFCQKPLGRTAGETRSVVEAARRADRLLAVDMSYRHTDAAQKLRRAISDGRLGRVYAADLVFHNAYGPDKPWFYDRALAGGGCVMDLGIHLVDLALWMLGSAPAGSPAGSLFRRGRRLKPPIDVVEDYATLELELESGAGVRITCSWNLPAGQEAVIEAAFYGTEAGAALKNVGGSFYDFTAELYHGTTRERISAPPDAWGGRAIVDWTERLASGAGFDPAAEELVRVADVLDGVYGR